MSQCCCAGLREALTNLLETSVDMATAYADHAHLMARRDATHALSTPCTCQGATGEDAKRLDWLESNTFTNREGEREIHYDFTGNLREAIDAALRRVQERKEV